MVSTVGEVGASWTDVMVIQVVGMGCDHMACTSTSMGSIGPEYANRPAQG